MLWLAPAMETVTVTGTGGGDPTQKSGPGTRQVVVKDSKNPQPCGVQRRSAKGGAGPIGTPADNDSRNIKSGRLVDTASTSAG